jgi:hypothetical protein
MTDYRYISIALEEMRAQKLYKMVIEQMIDMTDRIDILNSDIAELSALFSEIGIENDMAYYEKQQKIAYIKKLLETPR